MSRKEEWEARKEDYEQGTQTYEEGMKAQRAYWTAIKAQVEKKAPEKVARVERIMNTIDCLSKKADFHAPQKAFFTKIYLLGALWHFAALEIEMKKIRAVLGNQDN